MNIEAYDADSLRKMVRLLEYENKILKDKLKKAGISYEEVNPFEEKIESEEEYDLDQGSRIVNPPYITEKMAIRFFSMFWGREDVYARRGKNGGYFPQCANRWNDRLCPKQRKEKIFCDECENSESDRGLCRSDQPAGRTPVPHHNRGVICSKLTSATDTPFWHTFPASSE